MNHAADDDSNLGNTLTSSDLRGLLKAASLTEFCPDDVRQDVDVNFVKSSSLFDLVRSNLSDDENRINDKNPDEIEKVTSDDAKEVDVNEAKKSDDNPQPEIVRSDKLSLTDKGGNEVSTNDDNPDEAQTVADLDVGDPTTNIVYEGDVAPDAAVAFEASPLIEDRKGDTAQNLPIIESQEFLQELQKLQTEFDRKLEDERAHLEKTTEALFGAANFISAEIESKVSDFVLSIASDLAGTNIDKLPAAFFEKIERVAKQITENKNEVSVLLNPKDFEVIDVLDGTTNFNFEPKETLRRGEFEVKAHKSTATVSLFFSSVEG